MPANGETKNVIPMESDPTRAGNQNNILISIRGAVCVTIYPVMMKLKSESDNKIRLAGFKGCVTDSGLLQLHL